MSSIRLRPFMLADCNASYLRWLNDARTNRFLRFSAWTKDTARTWVLDVLSDPETRFFAITAHGRMIGTLKVSRCEAGAACANRFTGTQRHVVIGLMLGMLRGRGYGAQAIRLGTRFARRRWPGHLIIGGVEVLNAASLAAFASAGYRLEPPQLWAIHE